MGAFEELEDDVEAGDGLQGTGQVFGVAMMVEVVDEMGDVVLELFGMVVKIVGDAANEPGGARGDVLVVFPRIEVAEWGAGAARAELVVTMGAAQEAVAHGPVATIGLLTAAFVGVSRYWYSSLYS